MVWEAQSWLPGSQNCQDEFLTYFLRLKWLTLLETPVICEWLFGLEELPMITAAGGLQCWDEPTWSRLGKCLWKHCLLISRIKNNVTFASPVHEVIVVMALFSVWLATINHLMAAIISPSAVNYSHSSLVSSGHMLRLPPAWELHLRLYEMKGKSPNSAPVTRPKSAERQANKIKSVTLQLWKKNIWFYDLWKTLHSIISVFYDPQKEINGSIYLQTG